MSAKSICSCTITTEDKTAFHCLICEHLSRCKRSFFRLSAKHNVFIVLNRLPDTEDTTTPHPLEAHFSVTVRQFDQTVFKTLPEPAPSKPSFDNGGYL